MNPSRSVQHPCLVKYTAMTLTYINSRPCGGRRAKNRGILCSYLNYVYLLISREKPHTENSIVLYVCVYRHLCMYMSVSAEMKNGLLRPRLLFSLKCLSSTWVHLVRRIQVRDVQGTYTGYISVKCKACTQDTDPWCARQPRIYIYPTLINIGSLRNQYFWTHNVASR